MTREDPRASLPCRLQQNQRFYPSAPSSRAGGCLYSLQGCRYQFWALGVQKGLIKRPFVCNHSFIRLIALETTWAWVGKQSKQTVPFLCSKWQPPTGTDQGKWRQSSLQSISQIVSKGLSRQFSLQIWCQQRLSRFSYATTTWNGKTGFSGRYVLQTNPWYTSRHPGSCTNRSRVGRWLQPRAGVPNLLFPPAFYSAPCWPSSCITTCLTRNKATMYLDSTVKFCISPHVGWLQSLVIYLHVVKIKDKWRPALKIPQVDKTNLVMQIKPHLAYLARLTWPRPFLCTRLWKSQAKRELFPKVTSYQFHIIWEHSNIRTNLCKGHTVTAFSPYELLCNNLPPSLIPRSGLSAPASQTAFLVCAR